MPKPHAKEQDTGTNEAQGWARFERAVDAAVKSGPKHKSAQKPKERPATKGRVHKGKARD